MYLGVYAALGMGNSILILIVTLVSAYSAVIASRAMHSRMLAAVVRSPMSFFDTTPLGRIVNRFSKDIYNVDETIPRSLRSYLTTFLQVLRGRPLWGVIASCFAVRWHAPVTCRS